MALNTLTNVLHESEAYVNNLYSYFKIKNIRKITKLKLGANYKDHSSNSDEGCRCPVKFQNS